MKDVKLSSLSSPRMPTASSADEFIPTCTVVICTHDRPRELQHCLNAVNRLTYPHVEVLVVDNAPSDESTKEVAERMAVRYVVEPVRGLSRARNLGARVANG